MIFKSSQSKTNALKALLDSRVFLDIKKREDNYRFILTQPTEDPVVMIQLYAELDAGFRELEGFLKGLQRCDSGNGSLLATLLQKYFDEVQTQHEQNMSWIALYCDVCWPVDAEHPSPDNKQKLMLKKQIQERAAKKWNALKTCISLQYPLDQNEDELLSLKRDLDKDPVNSVSWRIAYNELSEKAYYRMMAFLVEARNAMHERFRILIASEILFPPGEQPLSKIKENFSPPGKDKQKAQNDFRLRIADYLLGYTLLGLPEVCQGARKNAIYRLAKSFRRFEMYTRRKRMAKAYTIVLALTGIVLFFSYSDWDERTGRRIMLTLKRLLKQDYSSLILKSKKEYFTSRILDIDREYSPSNIRLNLLQFRSLRMYEKEEGYAYFTEKVLEGFLLLLSNGEVKREFSDDVLYTARLLNPALSDVLKNIVHLYRLPVMHESRLRKEMLGLRRNLVRHRVFPFMFISLRDNVPYLFLFSEPILRTYVLTDFALEQLGLDGEQYNHISMFPGLAFLVEGTRYPFKDRAGFFDGEYAVIFRSLAPNIQWTVYHEVGHVIDHLRYKFEGRPYPENSELSSMLFPLIFADDRRDYITQRLIPKVIKGDRDDYYYQAAKGILNGFLVTLLGKDPSSSREFITNRFEKQRIDRIHQRIKALSSNEIKAIGYAMYQNPSKYLYTAGAGQYISAISNVEEIIYGVPHGITQRGFILPGSGFGFWGNGPRFIRDGSISGGEELTPFSLLLFLRNVFGIILSRRQSIQMASASEAIAAAVIVFITFNAFVILLHILGSSYRKKMFYGKSMGEIIESIYNQHAWSKGLSFGAELNEKRLLKKILSPEGGVPGDIKGSVGAFKAAAGDKERTLLDICLCLAPFQPSRGRIINKFHDLIFFLPFIGPFLGRASGLFPVQRVFHQRERYNDRITHLANSVTRNTDLPSFLSQFQGLINEYETTASAVVEEESVEDKAFSLMEVRMLQLLRNLPPRYHTNVKLLSSPLTHLNEESQEFDRLDEYYPGDDIRRIDWKATARSVTTKPFIRRYSCPYGVRTGFWLDMRFMHEKDGREQWAEDFVRALQMFHQLAEESILERLIFVKRNGKILEHKVNIRTKKNIYRTARKILTRVKEAKQKESEGQQVTLRGLRFYTKEENKRFLQVVQLADFGRGTQNIRRQRLRLKRMNIFVIGSMIKNSEEIQSVIGEDNKVFYW